MPPMGLAKVGRIVSVSAAGPGVCVRVRARVCGGARVRARGCVRVCAVWQGGWRLCLCRGWPPPRPACTPAACWTRRARRRPRGACARRAGGWGRPTAPTTRPLGRRTRSGGLCALQTALQAAQQPCKVLAGGASPAHELRGLRRIVRATDRAPTDATRARAPRAASALCHRCRDLQPAPSTSQTRNRPAGKRGISNVGRGLI